MLKSRLRTSVVALVVSAIALVGLGGTPAVAELDPTLLLPNLEPGRPDFIGTGWQGWESSYPIPFGVIFAGCTADERAEDGAQQCLRYHGVVENRGVGAFEMRWDVAELAGDRRARQRVRRANGSFVDINAGSFRLHPSHAHFHVDGLLEQRLWTSDEFGAKTGVEPVRAGRKLGFCLIDGVPLSDDAGPARYDARCLAPTEGAEQVMGVSPGWSDVYVPATPGNYIEISGLPVGRYVLETIVDPDGLFVESDETDNVRLDAIELCGYSHSNPVGFTDARPSNGSCIPPVVDAPLKLAFTPDPARTTGVLSPEGCEIEPGEPRGTLAPPPVEGVCHSAAAVATAAEATTAEFTSAPFEQSRALRGDGTVVLYFTSPANTSNAGDRYMDYQIDELTADGDARRLGTGQWRLPVIEGRQEVVFELSPNTVAAGSRLRLRWQQIDNWTYSGRYLYGGESYGDAGITLSIGSTS